jgi:tRNA modification GTPase
MREAGDAVEAIGVERAGKLVEAADVLVWLGDSAPAPDHARVLRVHAKADLGSESSGGSIPVSSVTGEGLPILLERVRELARSVLPAENAIALNRRQVQHIGEARAALAAAASARDLVLIAEDLRHARTAFDRLTGRAGVEDVLDALFGRFCLGK